MSDFFVHPNALVEADQIGRGTRIWAFAHVMRDVIIGADCNIGDHAFIESGVRVGSGVTIKNNVLLWKGVQIADYVFLGPNVVFTNDLYPRSPRMAEVKARYEKESHWLVPTIVEEGVSVGANSTVLCGVTLGRYCTVAAGSVVTKSVPPFHLVKGAPARPSGMVDRSGMVLKKAGTLWINPDTGKKYAWRGLNLVEADT